MANMFYTKHGDLNGLTALKMMIMTLKLKDDLARQKGLRM